ncbi:phytoene/squalene synthase family protein [Aquimarina sp. TRL1]|uniref:phytoene/squalene synthase family protein n=1 Tax=Aquimarina sp. (strain TRL1) TaxID=2736252 RepID=UPI001588D328|nr:phytoene/squalene synthase family protein [Aquimarina sp. TRL1]QKX07106.1 phytoene/squalene synthase family protein [Aquimarina sp. TRL1]
MKALFDSVSNQCSIITTKYYSTSFSLAVKMLAPSIRQDIYNIYGFVRFADEIVDTFHEYDKETLFVDFKKDLKKSLDRKISLNPILNSFQHTAHKHQIDDSLIDAFMKSMEQDLYKKDYHTIEEYKEYIYGSADVVGLMCLKVFVQGNEVQYERLKDSAMALGSAFQKVNFLRDLKADYEELNRTYFPHIDLTNLDEYTKMNIIQEIEEDFRKGYEGILLLPPEAKFGVYTAYRYYKSLLQKLKNTAPLEIKNARIRVPDHQKIGLLAQSYINYRLNLI